MTGLAKLKFVIIGVVLSFLSYLGIASHVQVGDDYANFRAYDHDFNISESASKSNDTTDAQ